MADDAMIYPVAVVRSATDPRVDNRESSWEALTAALTRPRRWEGDKLGCAGWMPVRLKEGVARRRSASVASVWALVADLDSGQLSFPALSRAVEGLRLRSVIHTTWSHRPDAPRARAVFPFVEPCPVERWREVWQGGQVWAAGWGATVDAACKDPARLYFVPALPAAEWEERRPWFRAAAFDGDPLDWATLIALVPKPKPRPSLTPSWASVGTDLGRLRGRMDRRAQGALNAAARKVAAAGKGGRNRTLYGAARWLGAIIGAGSLPEAEARSRLTEAAEAAGLAPAEASRAIDNGLAAGRTDEWQT